MGNSTTLQTIFIHIEKTAGVSLARSLIEPNVKRCVRASGVRNYIENRHADYVRGHTPYGLHRLTPRPVRYITMLRDPVERAVSWYYFITGIRRTDLFRRHMWHNYAESMSVMEFYEEPRFSNIQARFLAGIAYHKAYPFLHSSETFRRTLLRTAKAHLDGCVAFGLVSRFDESVRIFQGRMGWDRFKPATRQVNKNNRRPRLQEIDDLNPDALPALRASHDLDYELYRYAVRRFEDQLTVDISSATRQEPHD